MAQANAITDSGWRRSFLQIIPWHREIVAAFAGQRARQPGLARPGPLRPRPASSCSAELHLTTLRLPKAMRNRFRPLTFGSGARRLPTLCRKLKSIRDSFK